MLSESYQFVFGLFFDYGVAIFGPQELKFKPARRSASAKSFGTGLCGGFFENWRQTISESSKKTPFVIARKPLWQPALRAAVKGNGAEKRQRLSPAIISAVDILRQNSA